MQHFRWSPDFVYRTKQKLIGSLLQVKVICSQETKYNNMAEKSHSENTAQEDKQDITRNLPSLTFESALDEDELLLLHLRQQSHAHTVLVCASSAFLISILNETRQIRANLARTSKQRRAIQLLTADTLPKDPIKIGIIGCGRLGTHLAKSLLAFSDISPSELYISTRRPEAVGK